MTREVTLSKQLETEDERQKALHAALTPTLRSNAKTRNGVRELRDPTTRAALYEREAIPDWSSAAWRHWIVEHELGGRWPALDSCPVFRGADGSPRHVDTRPAHAAFEELAGVDGLADADARAALDVVHFMVRALMMGSPEDRQKLRELSEAVRGGPGAATACLDRTIQRLANVGPVGPERWPPDMLRRYIDDLYFRRVHEKAGGLTAGHERIDRMLAALQEMARSEYGHETIAERVARAQRGEELAISRGAAATVVALHGDTHVSREVMRSTVVTRAAEDEILLAMSGEHRTRLSFVITMIGDLARQDPRCLELDLGHVSELVDRVLRTRAHRKRGRSSLDVYGLGAALFISVNAFDYGLNGQDVDSVRTILRRAVAARKGRRC